MAEIGVVQLGIVTALAQQCIMVALLDDLALTQHNNAISVLDGRKTVCDDNRCSILKRDIQPFLNLGLCERIDAGCCFIQDEDGGVLQHYTRKRH